jgi:transcriptional regulator with XRE-family HTH domain
VLSVTGTTNHFNDGFQPHAFGERLKLAMKKANVGNEALAKSVGVGANVPTRWRGGATPSVPHAVAIAAALGCDLRWLLTGRSEQSAPAAATGAAERLREIGGRLSDLARQAEDSAERLLA